MKYSLTAPVLYKEVVIGKFAQFFYGVSERALRSEELPPGQSRICCRISKGVRPYYCLRHPPPVSDHGVTVYTKRQLLGLVQAMYLVYTPQDTIELSKARPDDFDDGQDLLHHLEEAVDLRRYTAIPNPIQSSDSLFPKLNRLVAGSWCVFDWCRPDDYDSNQIYGEFETTLAKRMIQITPPYVCKLHFPEGPFRYYPSKPDSIKVNVLHDAQFDSFGGSLLPGVLNIVHIKFGSEEDGSSPREEFLETIQNSAHTFVEAVSDWAHEQDMRVHDYHSTKVKFIIHRSNDYNADTETDAEKIQATADLRDLNDKLSEAIIEHDMYGNLHGWKGWKAVWIQDYLACPACEPEKYGKMKHLISI